MTHSYKDIAFQLTRTKRKTASIYIERDGTVSVRVPKTLPRKRLESILENKRVWIYRGLAEWQDLNAAKVKREYVNGEGFLYLGRTHRLKVVKRQSVPLQLKDGYFCLRLSNGTRPDEAFKRFYVEKGLEKIRARVKYYEAKMGLEAQDIQAKELFFRWASCSSKGRLNFHWKCIMAPLTIIDYIVVHELAHLKYTRHNEEFWNEVDKVMPNYHERRLWLKVNGAGMEL